MEVEAVTGERGGVFGKFGVVRVEIIRWRLRLRVGILGLLLVSVEGGERRLDAELALAAAAFCGGFFWGGEGEETEADEGGGRWSEMVVTDGDEFQVSEEGGSGESHGGVMGLD